MIEHSHWIEGLSAVLAAQKFCTVVSTVVQIHYSTLVLWFVLVHGTKVLYHTVVWTTIQSCYSMMVPLVVHIHDPSALWFKCFFACLLIQWNSTLVPFSSADLFQLPHSDFIGLLHSPWQEIHTLIAHCCGGWSPVSFLLFWEYCLLLLCITGEAASAIQCIGVPWNLSAIQKFSSGCLFFHTSL